MVLPNLIRHLENLSKFGLPTVVALNRFPTDTDDEIKKVIEVCKTFNVDAILAEHWARGGEGAANLAQKVVDIIDNNKNNLKFLYEDNDSPRTKIEVIAKEIYRANNVTFSPLAIKKLNEISSLGYDHFPVCMAKTQYSFSTDPTKKCAPVDHEINIREGSFVGRC